MYVKDLYEEVADTEMCSEGKLFVAIHAAVTVLRARYQPQYVETAPYRKPDSVDADLPIYPEYRAAIIQYILYQLTGDAQKQAEFLSLADMAYQNVWTRRGRGKRIRAHG